MNRLVNSIKQFFVYVILTLGIFAYADQGTVTFNALDVYNTNVSSKSIKKVDGYIYVANGDQQNVLILQDNGTVLTLVNTVTISENVVDVAINGDYLYVLSSAKLFVYSMDANRATITPEDNIPLNGSLNSLDVKGDYIYVANSTNGINVIDVSTKNDINQIATLTTTDAQEIVISSNVAYLADGWGGLRVIDIDNPASPQIVSTQSDGGTYLNIAVDSEKLFVAEATKVVAYDITNRLLPVKKGEITGLTNVISLYGYDSNVYVGIDGTGIQAYSSVDMTNLAANQLYNGTLKARDIFVIDNLGYIANDNNGISLVEFDSDFPSTYALVSANNVADIGGFPQTLEGSLPQNESDVDYLKINITNFGEFTINIDTSIENLKCSIVNEDNELVSDINNSLSDIENFNTPLQTGTYYIRIESTSNGSGTYEIDMSLSSDDFTDSIDGSLLISKWEEVSGQISSTTDKDVFKLFVSDIGTVTVSSSNVWLKARLLENGSDKVINGSGTLETGGIDFNVSKSGYYFVEVSGNIVGDYTFTTSFTQDDGGGYKDLGLPSLKKLVSTTIPGGDVVATSSSYVLVGTADKKLYRFDPVTLSANGVSTTKDVLKDLVIVDNYAYGALGNFGIGIYDIELMGTGGVKTANKTVQSENISKVIVDGNYLYTFGANTIYKINIASKSAPEVLTNESISVTGTINDIAIKYSTWNKTDSLNKTRNAYLYVATSTGLQVFSLDENNVKLETYDQSTTEIDRIEIVDNRLYTISGNKFEIFDISVPVYASSLGSTNLSESNVKDMDVRYDKVYISPKLKVVDISDERKPLQVTLKSDLVENNIDIVGGVGYVVTDSEVAVYEVANDFKNYTINLVQNITGNISPIVEKYSGVSSDTDKFILNVTQSGTLDINFTGTSGINITTNTNNQSLTQGIEISPSSTEYYIEVSGVEGNYSLQTLFTQDDYTDIIAEAQLLNFDDNGTIIKEANLTSTGNDKDYFKIELPERGSIVLKVSGDADANVTLVDSDQETVYNKPYNVVDGESEYLVETTLNPGTYYVMVQGRNDDLSKNVGSYKLTVQFVPTGDFVLKESVEYDQLVYGNTFIYTILKDKLNIFSHILQKQDTKDFDFDLTNMCSRPLVVGTHMFFNKKGSDTDLCDKTKYTLSNGGYVRYDLNLETDEHDYDVNSRNYAVYQDASMKLEFNNWPNGGFNAFAKLDDSTAAILDWNRIKTIDISNYKTSSYLEDLDVESLPNFFRVLVDGSIMYGLDNTNNKQLYIYNISNKVSPTLIKTLDLVSDSNDMVIKGNYLYVGSNQGIMQVYNISDPANASRVFEGMRPAGEPYNWYWQSVQDLELNGNTIYAKTNDGFFIVDISTPSTPRHLYNTNWGEHIDWDKADLVYKDGLLYYAKNYDLEVWDVSNSSNPFLKYSYNSISQIRAMDIEGDTIYFTGNYNNNSLYKLSLNELETNQYPTESFNVNHSIQEIDVDGSDIYLATGSGFRKYSEGNVTSNLSNTGADMTQFTWIDNTIDISGKTVLTLSTDITTDMTLDPANVYKISGQLKVTNGATLTIQPGQVLYGANSSSYLYVTRGSKIVASGNNSAPIIFTSSTDIGDNIAGNSKTKSGWGGLHIAGYAQVNKGEQTFEADTSDSDMNFGSNIGNENNSDNSGTLNFVRILNSGSYISNGNMSGLSLLGVGSGTTISNIAIESIGEDGLEIVGGNVNLSNIYIKDTSNDLLTWDLGYVGEINNIYLEGTSYAVDNAIEGKSYNSGDNGSSLGNEYISNPTIENLTIKIDSTNDPVIRLREGSGGQFNNVVINNLSNNNAVILLEDEVTINKSVGYNPKFQNTSIVMDRDTEQIQGDSNSGLTHSQVQSVIWDNYSGNQILDGSNNDNYTLMYVKEEHNHVESFDKTDSNMYLALNSSGYSIYDESSSNRINSIGYSQSEYNLHDMVVKDKIAYVANHSSEVGLYVFDLTDKNNIKQVKSIMLKANTNDTDSQRINKVSIDGNYIYPYNNGFIAKYDITDRKNPSLIKNSGYLSNSEIQYMHVEGIYGYAANHHYSNYGLTIYNVSTMVEVSSINLNNDIGTPYTTIKKGNYVYVGGDNGIAVVDVSDTSSLTLVDTIKFNDMGVVKSFVINDDDLYVGTDSKLVKYDITDPKTPKIQEIGTRREGYYDHNNNYVENGDFTDTYSFRMDKMWIYDGIIFGREYEHDQRMRIVNTNSPYKIPYTTEITNLNILYGDEKYLYEYGTVTKDVFGNDINDSMLSRVENTSFGYDAVSKGQYKVSGITLLKSYENTLFVAIDNKLEIVTFDGENESNVTGTITFNDSIDQLEVLDDKKTMYIHVKGSHYIKVYDISDITNIQKIQEEDTDEEINSLYFRFNKAYMSAKDYGVKIYYTDDNGKLIPQKDIENIGVEVDNVFSVDNSTFNYTAKEEGKNKLKVFTLRDRLTDGISDSLYTRGVTDNTPKEGCFIATAGYGSYFEPNVKVLREFRDNYLKTNAIGQMFVDFYYEHSPAIATSIASNEFAKSLVRGVLTPVVYTIKYPLIALLVIGVFMGYLFRRKLKTVLSSLLAIMLIGSLAGCSGGGSSYEKEKAPTNLDTNIAEAYFIDAAVSGVFYKGENVSGVTDKDGKFLYDKNALHNKEIEFSIGNVKLGKIEVDSINSDGKLFPNEILGLDRNNTTDQNVISMLQLLQSLDEDGDPSNGITVSADVQNKLEQSSINFIDNNVSSSDLNTTITSLSKTLIPTIRAINHFEKTLNSEIDGFDIDTVGPIAPSVKEDISVVNKNDVNITLLGEANATVYVNGTSINKVINTDGEVVITLNLGTTDGNKTFSIQLYDENNHAGEILTYSIFKDTTAPNIVTSNQANVIEKQIEAIDIEAIDDNAITYTITGEDAESFIIDANTGRVTFKNEPIFSEKATYSFDVVVSDGINETTQTITINIKDPDSTYVLQVYKPEVRTYREGENIHISLNTNNSVKVSTHDARIKLIIGGVEKYATVTSVGYYTYSLNFEYHVEKDLVDNDGISMNNIIDLNGATIQDVNGNDMDLYFIVPDMSDIKVDGTPDMSQPKYTASLSTYIYNGYGDNGNKFFGVTPQDDRYLFMTVYPENSIIRYDTHYSNYSSAKLLTNVTNPHGVHYDKDSDKFFVADLNNQSVRQYTYDFNNGSISEDKSQTIGSEPVNLITVGDNLYVGDRSEKKIYILNKDDLNTTDSISFSDYTQGCTAGDGGDGHIDFANDGEFLYVVHGSYNEERCGISGALKINLQTKEIVNISINDVNGTAQNFNGITIYDQLLYLNSGTHGFVAKKDGEVLQSWELKNPNDYYEAYYLGVEVMDDKVYFPMGRGGDQYHILQYDIPFKPFYVSSVVYDDSNTDDTANDDALYLYLSSSLDINSIPTNISDAYSVVGTGAIGSASTNIYMDNFKEHKIELNSNGTDSSKLEVYSSSIKPQANTLQSINGKYMLDSSVVVEDVIRLKKTGDQDSSVSGSDGDYQYGHSSNFVRANEIVTDNLTGLQWLDDNSSGTTSLTWESAKAHCANKVFNGFSDWRLPTKEEFDTILDFNNINPAIDSIFVNYGNSDNWTSTPDVGSSDNAWAIGFTNGHTLKYLKTNAIYVRCVRN